MADINPKDVFDILLESLKIQASKYKIIVDNDALTHEQRKEFDTEIKQMFDLLTNMTNSTIVYTSAEIQALKIQYESKLQELQNTLNSIDVTTVKGEKGDTGADGQDGQDGIQGPQGEKGDTGADGQDGQDGIQGPQGVKGEKGDTGADGQDGQDGIQGPQGPQGESPDLSSILTRLTQLELQIQSLGGFIPEPIDSIHSVDGDEYTIENQKYSFTYLSDNSFKIRVVRDSQLNSHSLLFANLGILPSNISKINYSAVYSSRVFDFNDNLEPIYQNVDFDFSKFSFELNDTISYPSSSSSVSVDRIEYYESSIASKYATDNLNLSEVLKSFIAVADGSLILANSRDINCSFYVEDIVITLNYGHGLDVSSFIFDGYSKLENWGQESRLMEFNLNDSVSFSSVWDDISPYLEQLTPFNNSSNSGGGAF